MAIEFNCPHCQLHYRLKDEFAGKRATCKNAACRQVLVIPQPRAATIPPSIAELGGIVPDEPVRDRAAPVKPPADVEAAALAAFADGPKSGAAAGPDHAIPITCQFCGHQWTEPLAKAGKTVLCPDPDCRRPTKVPVPAKAAQTQDWRQGNQTGPTLAKQNFEQPKDVVNAAEAKVVSKKAWEAGGGAEQDYEPVPLSRRVMVGLVVVVPVLLLVAGAAYLWRSTTTAKKERVIEGAIAELKDAPDIGPAEAPVFAAVLQLAAGEWALREEGVEKDKALRNAMTHFTLAREDLRHAAAKDDPRKPTAGERAAVAGELALATLALGGTDAEAKDKTRIRWVPEAAANRPLKINEKVETVHTELQRTLQLLQDADFDTRVALVRRLTRELVRRGQVDLATGVPVMLFTAPEQPEARAVVAIELYRADRGSAKARQIADELKAQLAGGAGGKSPVPASAVTLWLLLGVEKPPVIVAPPPSNPTQAVQDATRLAYVGLYALQDKTKEALDLAVRPGSPAGQLRALVAVAEWAADPGAAFDLAAGIAARGGKKGEPSTQPPPAAVFRLAQLAEKAGKGEAAKQLTAALPDDGYKAWVKGDSFRAANTPENKDPFDLAAAEVPDDSTKLRAGHAWAGLWVARHNARVAADKQVKTVPTWAKGTIRPFGVAGLALGQQDR